MHKKINEKTIGEKVLMWFRNDLRLADNLALDEACRAGTVVPIYILDPQDSLGAASKWWLDHSLRKLNLSLEDTLTIYEGDKFELLPKVMQANGVTKIFWNINFERYWQEKKLAKLFEHLKTKSNKKVEFYSYNCSLLWNPATILKHDGSTYKVFTPFYRKGCLASGDPRVPIPAPTKFSACKSALAPNYEFTEEKWHQKMEEYWSAQENPGNNESLQPQKAVSSGGSGLSDEPALLQRESQFLSEKAFPQNSVNSSKNDKLTLGRSIKIGEAAAMERLANFAFPKTGPNSSKSIKIKESISFAFQSANQNSSNSINHHSPALNSAKPDAKHFAGPAYAPHGNPNHDGTPPGILNYKEGRNFPAKANCSALSPHLHFGEISPNQVWYCVKSACEKASNQEANLEKTRESKHIEKNSGNATDQSSSISKEDLDHFHSELGWREFSYYILYHFPNLPIQNFQSKFDKFKWKNNLDAFESWKKGKTGYPIVDAGMRELWQTGYMHNRVRMITASFLIKNLMLDWRLGEAWFYDCLVDADLASNSASWQWVAGTGTDAAPYFRIFNPILQGEKFDPEGVYTLKYVPELSKLPKKYLFCPFEAPEKVLVEAEIKLGYHYPAPIIDLDDSRNSALEEYKKISMESKMSG